MEEGEEGRACRVTRSGTHRWQKSRGRTAKVSYACETCQGQELARDPLLPPDVETVIAPPAESPNRRDLPRPDNGS